MIGGIIIVVGIIAMVMMHEGGHFLAAKAVGMKATEFFFGFGPKLWSVQRGETEYGVKALPLGGYVRIVGMNPYEEVDPGDEGRTYRERPFWAKSVVVLAGVVSHFVVAFLIFFLIFAVVGVGRPTTAIERLSTELEDGSPTPAVLAGIEPGDRIVSLNGIPTPEWGDIVELIQARPGERVELGVERDGVLVPLTATLAVDRNEASGEETGFLGVQPARTSERVNPLVGLGRAGDAVADATNVSLRGLWSLVSNLGDLVVAAFTDDQTVLDEVRPASPIGLVQLGASAQRLGLEVTLELLALINIFVGLFNLVPLYPLDGGHFSVALYEKVTGRQADVRKLVPVAAAVVIFIVLLGVLAIYLDIVRPFQGLG
ncbi:MAG: RIP metalloprotease [Acidimicrobiia bacterium]